MLALQARSPLEHLFYLIFCYYINNDRPQVHWLSEIQFNLLNLIIIIIIIIEDGN